jgi:spermidine synthase
LKNQLDKGDLFGVALGIFTTFCQVTLMREALALSGGNELTIGLGFAAWLVGVGCGALLGGYLPWPARARIIGAISAIPLSLLGLLVLRLHRDVIDPGPGSDPSIGQLVVLFSVGLGLGGSIMGFLFTVAARASAVESRSPVSRLYTAEAIGALIAGIAFAGYLAVTYSQFAIVAGAGVLLILAASYQEPRVLWRRIGQVCAAAVLLIVVAGQPGELDKWSHRRAFSSLGAAGQLVDSIESAYGRLSLGHSDDQYQLYTNGRFNHAFPDPWERQLPIHLALSQHPQPKKILIVEGGPADLLEAALAHDPQQVVLTYLDDRAHALCHPFWSPSTHAALEDPRVVVIKNDGRNYIESTSERFDVVFISAGPPLSGQDNRYHTRDFFASVAQIMNQGGTMSVLASGGANVLAPEAARAAASELATVRSVFPETVIVPGTTIMIHGAKRPGVVTNKAEELAVRYAKRNVAVDFFSSRRFADLYKASSIAAVEEQLAKWPQVVNTDERPLVYLANLQLWEHSLLGVGTAGDSTLTGLAERLSIFWLIIPLAIWLIWAVVRFGRRGTGPGDAIFSIATTGAAGMVVEVVILYAFQVASGRLYIGLALLVAMFMAGLALGAFLGRRLLAGGTTRDAVVADGTVLVFLMMSGPVITATASAPWLPVVWSLISGIVTGAAFPALLGLAARYRGKDERRAAAMIEAADHFGAAFGALVTGVSWLPVFGITNTCLLFAFFKVASLAGVVLGTHRKKMV